MAAANGLLARVWPGFFQQAFVVTDLDAAQQAFSATLGCERYNLLPPTSLPYRYRGEVVEATLAIAFGRSGGVQIELIQPVAGDGLHAEFLRTNGPGAHHLGFIVDSLDDVLAAASATGFAECMGGEFGNLRFAYVDSYDALGYYIELVEDPDGLMRQLTPE